MQTKIKLSGFLLLAVIFLGHIKSEEAGMKYCAEWLQTFVKDLPIHFIENQPNFNTL
ncbi:hypothetical protein [Tangfeifania diversioriginum]|uniref:hypothetical protein n=1 Tax=Tangfeifania diversioriginum TaxID=1168035 RepID=UPI001587379D|nr:hypothetical protein [Tangfeifania diversioriginum]